MPLSIWLGLEDCVQAISGRRPRSMLDAGIGFGLFGHLLRQYLDVWEGHIERADWRIRIDGIEIDERRIQPRARYLYDEVFVGDIRDLVPTCAARRSYDVILPKTALFGRIDERETRVLAGCSKCTFFDLCYGGCMFHSLKNSGLFEEKDYYCAGYKCTSSTSCGVCMRIYGAHKRVVQQGRPAGRRR